MQSACRIALVAATLLGWCLQASHATPPLSVSDYFAPTNYALNDAVDTIQKVTIAFGSLSWIGSTLVLLTPVLWPSMWRGKVCMQMICMISLCDLLSSFLAAFGFPTNTTWCGAQGALIFFFSRASWAWSVLCLYMLFKIIVSGYVPLKMRTMHLMVWPISVVLELLPLTDNTWYGTTWFLMGKQLCNFDTQNKHYFIWVGILFVAPIVIATLALLFLSAMLWLRMRRMNAGYHRALVKSVVLYPCVTLLACIPLIALFVWDASGSYISSPSFDLTSDYYFEYSFVGYVNAWLNLQGFLNAVVFFCNSGESRERWHKLMRGFLLQLQMRYCVSRSDAERMAKEVEAQASLLHIKDFLDDGEMELAIQDQIREERLSSGRMSVQPPVRDASETLNEI